MRIPTSGRSLALPLALALAACNGPKAAVRDFLDPYRVVVGAGSGAGVRFSSMGLVHTGLEFGVKPDFGAIGWKYGRPFAFHNAADRLGFDADQALVYETRSLFGADELTGSYRLARRSFALFPAVFTWVDSADPTRSEWTVDPERVELADEHYLWSARTWKDERFAMVHAFDIETEVMLLGYIDVGYSPGEFVDFVTSLFGFDLAGDDDR